MKTKVNAALVIVGAAILAAGCGSRQSRSNAPATTDGGFLVVGQDSQRASKGEPPVVLEPTQMGVPNLAKAQRFGCIGSDPAKPGDFVVFEIPLDPGTGKSDTEYQVAISKGRETLLSYSRFVNVRVVDENKPHTSAIIWFHVDPAWSKADGTTTDVEFGVTSQAGGSGVAKFKVAASK